MCLRWELKIEYNVLVMVLNRIVFNSNSIIVFSVCRNCTFIIVNEWALQLLYSYWVLLYATPEQTFHTYPKWQYIPFGTLNANNTTFKTHPCFSSNTKSYLKPFFSFSFLYYILTLFDLTFSFKSKLCISGFSYF
jgi:hypothetical protein